MPDMLIRNLDEKTLERLKARAERNRRSLQGEAKYLLEQAAGAEDIAGMLDRWRARFQGRSLESSSDLIREDRDR